MLVEESRAGAPCVRQPNICCTICVVRDLESLAQGRLSDVFFSKISLTHTPRHPQVPSYAMNENPLAFPVHRYCRFMGPATHIVTHTQNTSRRRIGDCLAMIELLFILVSVSLTNVWSRDSCYAVKLPATESIALEQIFSPWSRGW